MTGFRAATKRQAKARVAIFGPSGAGKTMSALRIATGMGGRIGVIDSEYGTASKYADRYSFDALDLVDCTIRGYAQALDAGARGGYAVLIVDSLSHAWQELLREVDRLAATKYRGNTFSAWSEGTPMQRSLIAALMSSPCHLIATMRSKTEWGVTTTDRGKKAPERIGLAPEQGKGIEYEFDLLLQMNADHIAHVIKDRTGHFQDQLLELPGEQFGADLIAWLNDGVVPEPAPEPASEPALVPGLTPATLEDLMAQVVAAHETRALIAIHERAVVSLAAGVIDDEAFQGIRRSCRARLDDLTTQTP